MCVDIYVMCDFLFDKNRGVSKIFVKIPDNNFHENSSGGSRAVLADKRTDGRVIVAFRSSVTNAPKTDVKCRPKSDHRRS